MNKRSDTPNNGTTTPLQVQDRESSFAAALTFRAPADTLNAILQVDGQMIDSIQVVGVSTTHIQLSGAILPVKIHSTIDIELFDEMLRMNVQAIVESKDAFGLTGRFVQPGNLLQDWIASIIG